MVTVGVSQGLDVVARSLLDPGDEVIVPDPGFVTYESVIQFCGCTPVRVPLRESRGFRIDPAEVEAAITPKTKLIIIDSPNNPTGAALDQATATALGQIAARHDVYLLSDEVYAKMCYAEPPASPTVLDRCRSHCVLLNGFSKTYAMTGWRLGYGIGPRAVIDKMGTLLQILVGSMPPFVQMGGKAALEGDQGIVAERVATLKTKRDALVAGLSSLPGVTCLTPPGAFYAFPNIAGTGMDDVRFASLMLEEAGVACLPGSSFGPNGAGYVRFCYSAPIGQIEEAIERMRRTLAAQPHP
jgi:aspartate aminotransferase